MDGHIGRLGRPHVRRTSQHAQVSLKDHEVSVAEILVAKIITRPTLENTNFETFNDF